MLKKLEDINNNPKSVGRFSPYQRRQVNSIAQKLTYVIENLVGKH